MRKFYDLKYPIDFI